MSFLFLSPSTSDSDVFFAGQTECVWMNRLADEMTPYLTCSGINTARNEPDCTVNTAIRQVNLGAHDFYLALRTGAALEQMAGKLRGVTVQYCPDSPDSLKMAEILIDNMKTIYPLPKNVLAEPGKKTEAQLHLSAAPSCVAEVGYGDNADDAQWLAGQLPSIAKTMALAVTEYFGLPFLLPGSTYPAMADRQTDLLGGPEPGFPVVSSVAPGSLLTVYSEYNGWYVAQAGKLVGYIDMQAVTLL